MKTCPNCGEQNDKQNLYCENCGAVIFSNKPNKENGVKTSQENITK